MQDVHDFVVAFREAEHSAYRAMLLEPDYERFREARRALEIFAPTIRLSSQIVRDRDESLPPTVDAELELKNSYAPRALLRLEMYTMPNGNPMYAAYMTGTNTLPNTGSPVLRTRLRYLIDKRSNELKILGFQHAPNVAFPYWETTGGHEVILPDKPDDVVVYIDEE